MLVIRVHFLYELWFTKPYNGNRLGRISRAPETESERKTRFLDSAYTIKTRYTSYIGFAHWAGDDDEKNSTSPVISPDTGWFTSVIPSAPGGGYFVIEKFLPPGYRNGGEFFRAKLAALRRHRVNLYSNDLSRRIWWKKRNRDTGLRARQFHLRLRFLAGPTKSWRLGAHYEFVNIRPATYTPHSPA